MEKVEIDSWNFQRDCLILTTQLIRRAYGLHRQHGINFGAATQSPGVTRRRIETASATWVARIGQTIVGVVSYYERVRYPQSEPKWYARPGVCHFGQFAVAPERQHIGIGRDLLSRVEDRATADRKVELCCDTAISATKLLSFYQRLGFEPVDRHQWRDQNYESVVLSKRLI
jgi:GNAT superfamily N-acetyltransferase